MASATRMSPHAVIHPSPDQVYTNLGEEAVILSLEDGVYYGLNAVGARVWELIQGGASLGAVCAALTQEFDVEPDRCADDVEALVSDLRDRRLVEVSPEADGG